MLIQVTPAFACDAGRSVFRPRGIVEFVPGGVVQSFTSEARSNSIEVARTFTPIFVDFEGGRHEQRLEFEEPVADIARNRVEGATLRSSKIVLPEGCFCGRSSGCHGFGAFDKAGSSWFDAVSEEHGLTEDGETVAPIIEA